MMYFPLLFILGWQTPPLPSGSTPLDRGTLTSQLILDENMRDRFVFGFGLCYISKTIISEENRHMKNSENR